MENSSNAVGNSLAQRRSEALCFSFHKEQEGKRTWTILGNVGTFQETFVALETFVPGFGLCVLSTRCATHNSSPPWVLTTQESEAVCSASRTHNSLQGIIYGIEIQGSDR